MKLLTYLYRLFRGTTRPTPPVLINRKTFLQSIGINNNNLIEAFQNIEDAKWELFLSARENAIKEMDMGNG